jgi:hypothetical protein
MVRGRALLVPALALALAVLSVGGSTAEAAQPIGPQQHFRGVVNGSKQDAVVHTVCAGPSAPGRTGPVAGGQTVAVVRGRAGGGFTGPFTQVYAWFVPAQPWPAPTQLVLTAYGTKVAIPTSVQVPCDGKGTVEFTSCPYLSPCPFGWVPTAVHVRFVDIAAAQPSTG